MLEKIATNTIIVRQLLIGPGLLAAKNNLINVSVRSERDRGSQSIDHNNRIKKCGRNNFQKITVKKGA